jgi:ApaG protein
MNAERQFSIMVQPRYVPGESNPASRRYVFAYTITIANVGNEPARLVNRRWLITNADGDRREVKGKGVVGEQPYIEPGDAFRYTSAAVIETAVGTMQGSYEFEDDSGRLFEVPVPMFSLSVPNAIH